MADSDPDPTRRRLIRALPAAAGVGLAGCSGGGGDGTATPTATAAETGTPTATPTATSTATQTATDTPEPPNVERRTIQRDRPAIKHVRTLVSGTLTWPTIEWGNDIDPQILGRWAVEGEVFALDSTGAFRIADAESETTGSYRTVRNRLDLKPSGGETTSYRYERSTSDSTPILSIFSDGERVASYEQVESWADQRSVIETFRDLQALPAADGSTEQSSVRTGSSGTGFVVTPEGHLVTNAHVVGAHQSPERRLFTRHARTSRDAIRESLAGDENYTDAQKAEIGSILYDKMVPYYAREGSFSGVSESVEVLNRRTTDAGEVTADRWPATVEAEGSVVTETDGEPSWGRDVAILKVDQSPLQTVSIGSSASLGTGAEVFVVGYPAIGVSDLFADAASDLTPSLTSGVVSARRTLNSGVEAIQTDAAINSGNSGGPIYDDGGQVVGIATFAPTDLDLEQIQFGLPIEEATVFMDQLGIENRDSEMEADFEAGLEAYWRGDCETATARMEAVLAAAPHHPTARQFIADCEAGRAPGQD